MPALRSTLLGEDNQGSRIPQSRGPPHPVLCRSSALLPRPAPHLLRCLRVKVRLQQRDRELDLPGTVVWLHGWAAAAGPALRRAGRRWDSGLGRARSLSAPLSSGPGPSPARSAPGSRLGAPSSQPWGFCGRRLAPHASLTAPLSPPARSLNPVVAAPPAAGLPAP